METISLFFFVLSSLGLRTPTPTLPLPRHRDVIEFCRASPPSLGFLPFRVSLWATMPQCVAPSLSYLPWCFSVFLTLPRSVCLSPPSLSLSSLSLLSISDALFFLNFHHRFLFISFTLSSYLHIFLSFYFSFLIFFSLFIQPKILLSFSAFSTPSVTKKKKTEFCTEQQTFVHLFAATSKN